MCPIVIYILLGLAVGYLGGFAGIGGAPFIITFLVLVCGMSQLEAQGNVLTMMLGPMSLLGVSSMYEYVKKQWTEIIVGVIAYCIWSYVGAVIAFGMGEGNTHFFFAVLLFVIAALQIHSLVFKKDDNQDKTKTKLPLIIIFLLSSFTGIVGGVFGIGAGILMIPILMGIFHLDKNYARALSLAILMPPVSYGAYIKYNAEIDINWQIVLILFFSYFAANYFGAKSGKKISNKVFKFVYASILIAIAVIYIAKS